MTGLSSPCPFPGAEGALRLERKERARTAAPSHRRPQPRSRERTTCTNLQPGTPASGNPLLDEKDAARGLPHGGAQAAPETAGYRRAHQQLT